jgi:L-threonylcarbamoyladenylate synthase
VEKIFRAKGRPHSDPLIVHIHDEAELAEICEVNAAARVLARKFWPGPLTLVLPKKPAIPDNVTAGQPSVAVRMPAHPLLRRLLAKAGVPVAAPSANPFGYVSPTTAQHVADNLDLKISHILDGGPCRVGVESTILDLRNEARPRLLRPGAISRQELERALRRPVATARHRAAPKTAAQIAPGLLARHYSPRTSVSLHDRIEATRPANEAFVFLRKPAGRLARNVFWLDPKGSLDGAARRLFGVLRRLDAMRWKKIHVERAPGDGLAEAINDRLRRAAAR